MTTDDDWLHNRLLPSKQKILGSILGGDTNLSVMSGGASGVQICQIKNVVTPRE